METVLFELHFRWGDLPVLLIPLLVGAGFLAVSRRLTPARRPAEYPASPVERDLTASPAVKWLLRGIALLSGVVFLLSGVSYVTEYAHLKTRYEAGEYLTVEGFVEELTVTEYPDKGGDGFTVDGVTFAYSSGDLTLHGYRREAQRGGIVTREGQYLVIRYIPDPYTETNHIVYIAEKEAPAS